MMISFTTVMVKSRQVLQLSLEREYRLITDRFRVFPVTPSYVSWWVHTTLRFGGGSEVTGIRELPGKHDSKIWL
jgi:hypothetical protein